MSPWNPWLWAPPLWFMLNCRSGGPPDPGEAAPPTQPQTMDPGGFPDRAGLPIWFRPDSWPMFTSFFWKLPFGCYVSVPSLREAGSCIFFSADPSSSTSGCPICTEGLSGEPVQNCRVLAPAPELPGVHTQESVLRRLCSRSCFRWSLAHAGDRRPQSPRPLSHHSLPSH